MQSPAPADAVVATAPAVEVPTAATSADAEDGPSDHPPSTRAGAAFAPAEILRQAGAENFPVAPRWLPARLRDDLTAVYGFARLVDDLGDEADTDRLAALDEVEADLHRVWDGTPRLALLAALVPTVRRCGLAREPFLALIEANRIDQRVRRYETFAQLRGYCAYSADPVGRIVLGIFGVATTERVAAADRVCTALQIVEHCQDVREDYQAGRIYLPATDLRAFGVAESALGAPAAGPAVRALLRFEVDRAERWLDAGAPLVGMLTGTARLAVAGFVGGGRAAIAAIRAADHDVLAATPRPSRAGVALAAARAWGRRGR